MPALFRPTATLGGGGLSAAPAPEGQRALASTWTAFNDGVATFSDGDTGVEITLPAGTAYATPDAAPGLYAAIEDAFGESGAVVDQYAIYKALVASLTQINSDLEDAYAALILYNDGSTGGTAPPTSTTEGIGVGINYTSGEWEVGIWRNAGAGWSLTGAPADSTNPDTEAAVAEFMPEQTGARWLGVAAPVTLGGDPIGGTNQFTADVTANLGDGPLNSVALVCGRLGTAGASAAWEVHGGLFAWDPKADITGDIP